MASEFFSVGVSYDTVTPESAEHGDYDDTGWTEEHVPMTLRDALETIRRYGPYDGVNDTWNGVALYEVDGDIDYRTGEVERHAVHIEGSTRNVARLLKLAKRWTA